MQPLSIAVILASCLIYGCNASSRGPRGAADEPPPAPREFRAVWVATVANIDWPTKPGLSTDQQKAEAIAILDRAKELNLNAVILQVRPAADALYASDYEPWSYYLTGEQGKAPEPFYDPLQFWIEESHKRGMELHAWFNPYRARHGGAKYETAANHVSKTNPDIVKEFNNWQWLDPAEPEAQDLTYNVFLDVARRYDVDGIHIDDYFYPYPDYLKGADFPDDPAWKRYQQSGGTLSRDDWRRDSVNQLIERIYRELRAKGKPVQFGISPFGIARPGKPPEVKSSFDQYDKLYADAELWLKRGWLDYWTPQLYWKIDSDQPYAALLRWWVEQNTHGRHIWPGNFTSRVGDGEQNWRAQEVVDQIEMTRATDGATGNVHFSMKVFMSDRDGIVEALRDGVYSEPALVPASPWLADRPAAAPKVRVKAGRVEITSAGQDRPWQYAVWSKYGDQWKFSILPGDADGFDLNADASGRMPAAVWVSAVDRRGNESQRVNARVRKR